LFLSINPFLNWALILNAPADMSRELGILSLVVFVFFSLQFVLQLITTVLTANQQPSGASLVHFIGSLLSLIFIFLVTRFTKGNLIYFGISISVMPVVVMLGANLFLYRGKYRQFSPSLEFVNFRFARPLMGLGLKFFIIQVSAIILFQTNNLIISQVLGPDQVVTYNIAFKYFWILHMVFLIVLSPFWSAYTDAYFRNDIAWIRRTTTKLILFWFVLVFALCIMLACSDIFYRLWVGNTIQIPFKLSFACAVYVLIITWSSIFVNFVNGIGKIRLQLFYSVAIAIINFPLAIFFSRNLGFGVTGLVYSNCICLLIGAIAGTIQYRLIITKKARGIWQQ
jgi:O-antigen/teichoic acid export membrane protein